MKVSSFLLVIILNDARCRKEKTMIEKSRDQRPSNQRAATGGYQRLALHGGGLPQQ